MPRDNMLKYYVPVHINPIEFYSRTFPESLPKQEGFEYCTSEEEAKTRLSALRKDVDTFPLMKVGFGPDGKQVLEYPRMEAIYTVNVSPEKHRRLQIQELSAEKPFPKESLNAHEIRHVDITIQGDMLHDPKSYQEDVWIGAVPQHKEAYKALTVRDAHLSTLAHQCWHDGIAGRKQIDVGDSEHTTEDKELLRRVYAQDPKHAEQGLADQVFDDTRRMVGQTCSLRAVLDMEKARSLFEEQLAGMQNVSEVERVALAMDNVMAHMIAQASPAEQPMLADIKQTVPNIINTISAEIKEMEEVLGEHEVRLFRPLFARLNEEERKMYMNEYNHQIQMGAAPADAANAAWKTVEEHAKDEERAQELFEMRDIELTVEENLEAEFEEEQGAHEHIQEEDQHLNDAYLEEEETGLVPV